MTLLTTWSLQSPDTTAWQASISTAGIVTWNTIGAPITVTPPVYGDQVNPAAIWTPSISNAGLVTITSGAEAGQDRAALVDANGVQYVASVVSGIVYFRAPTVSVGDLITFGLFEQETVPMLVKAIDPGPDLTATLTFVDAAPGVHRASDGVIPAFQSHITRPQIGPDPVPKPLIDGIASDETVMLRSTDGSLVPRIVVSLHVASGAVVPAVWVEVQHRLSRSTSQWDRQLVTAASSTEISILSVMEGITYDLRFRTIGAVGQTSDWVTIDTYAVLGKTSPAPDVTGLSLNGQQLQWSYPSAPQDFSGFRVRVHVGQRTSWGDAMPLHDGLVSQTSYLLFRDTGARTYLVKAVDTSGNESLGVASLFVDYGALVTQNVAEIVDLKALGFPGTYTDASVLGGNLVADSAALLWTTDAHPLWSTDTALLWPGAYTGLQYVATVTPPLAWIGGTLLLDLVVSGTGLRLEYAAVWTQLWSDAATPLWSDDSALLWSNPDGAFLPWPGQLTGYTRQVYQIRLTLNAGSVQGVVSQYQAVFDMPDLSEVLTNVPLSAAGTRLPVTKSYAAILVVSPTLVEDGGSARRIRVLDKEVSGPLVLAVDGSEAAVDAHGDFTIQGY